MEPPTPARTFTWWHKHECQRTAARLKILFLQRNATGAMQHERTRDAERGRGGCSRASDAPLSCDICYLFHGKIKKIKIKIFGVYNKWVKLVVFGAVRTGKKQINFKPLKRTIIVSVCLYTGKGLNQSI